MGRLDDLACFVRVMEFGSFTAAARDLGLPRSTLSRRVAALEADRGLRLLQRTTRRVEPTMAGRLLFERAAPALHQLDSAMAAVSVVERPLLRLDAPPGLAPRALSRLAGLELPVQLVRHLAAADVTLCVGERPRGDDRQVVELGGLPWVLCASARYLAGAGLPRSVGDLGQHAAVVRSEGPPPYLWTVFVAGRVRRLPVRPGAVVHSEELALQAALDGRGLARLPRWRAAEALEAGLLVAVLPGLEGPTEPVWARIDPQRAGDSVIVAVLEALAAGFE